MIVGVYIDDLQLTGSNEENLRNFKLELMKLFEMTDLGLLSTYLGIQVIQEKRGNFFESKSICKTST